MVKTKKLDDEGFGRITMRDYLKIVKLAVSHNLE